MIRSTQPEWNTQRHNDGKHSKADKVQKSEKINLSNEDPRAGSVEEDGLKKEYWPFLNTNQHVSLSLLGVSLWPGG